MKSILLTICHVLWLTLPISATAANIWPSNEKNGYFRGIVIEGEIKFGDFDRFLDLIKTNHGQVNSIYLYSSGGDFYEAMKIGQAIRELELHSQVPMKGENNYPDCQESKWSYVPLPKNKKNCSCASACFFIHIGGISRGGTYLAVHRPYFATNKFGELSVVEAKKEFDTLQNSARKYMGTMNVPEHIQEDVLGTPSDRILILSDKTIKTYFWLDLPYRHEWLMNKCSRLSSDEKSRFEAYKKKVSRLRNPSARDFSKSDLNDYVTLSDKQMEEVECVSSVVKESRIKAYKRYFDK